MSDQICNLCECGESLDEDNIFYCCDKCGLTVHRWCYNDPKMLQSDWYCRPCQAWIEGTHNVPTERLKCEICGLKTNTIEAFTNVATSGYEEKPSWVHMACAQYIRKTWFANPETCADVQIDEPSCTGICCICKRSRGAKLECMSGDCDVKFHAICGIRSQCYVSFHPSESEQVVSYCQAHRWNGEALALGHLPKYGQQATRNKTKDAIVRDKTKSKICEYCGVETWSFSQHVKIHFPGKHFCPICGERFLRTNVRRDHMQNRHDEFKCEKCGKDCITPDLLLKHTCQSKSALGAILGTTPTKKRKKRKIAPRNSKSPKKKKKCEYCGFETFFLTRHLQSHFSSLFQCEKCDESFSRQSELDIHIQSKHCQPETNGYSSSGGEFRYKTEFVGSTEDKPQEFYGRIEDEFPGNGHTEGGGDGEGDLRENEDAEEISNGNGLSDTFAGEFEGTTLLDDSRKAKLMEYLGTLRAKKLIYKASVHGFGSQTFHDRCDSRGPTVAVIKRKGARTVFGGYTPLSWGQANPNYPNYNDDSKYRSFIFTMSDDSGYPAKFQHRFHASYAIFCNNAYGPTFGSGHDLHICSDSDSSKSSYTANTSSCYGIPSKTTLCGKGNYFLIDEIEVFTVE